MSVISQDSPRDQIYQFTDKQGGAGKLGATRNRLRGTPALFTAQVIDDTRQIRYQEKNRRFIHVTPDTSNAKIKSAKKLIGQRYGLVPEEYEEHVVSSADKERARAIINMLVDKLIDHSKLLKPKESGVKIPFTESINYGIGDEETEWSMTVMDRTIRYLAIITKANMDSRPRIIDTETGKFYPIATFKDLKETLPLMNVGASITRPYIGYWYNNVFMPAFKDLNGQPNARYTDNGEVSEKETYVGLTTEQLTYWTQKVMHVSLNTEAIRRQYLYPLSNVGIINIVKSTINKNEILAFPVDETGGVSSIFDDQNDLRLRVSRELFPNKNLLEKEFRTFIKHGVSEGSTEIFHKFRLVDHEGIEDIAAGQLIDKYLGDPETCFKTDSDVEKEKNIFTPHWRRDLQQLHNNSIEESSTHIEKYVHRDMRFIKGKWYCQACGLNGDRFYMESQECTEPNS